MYYNNNEQMKAATHIIYDLFIIHICIYFTFVPIVQASDFCPLNSYIIETILRRLAQQCMA